LEIGSKLDALKCKTLDWVDNKKLKVYKERFVVDFVAMLCEYFEKPENKNKKEQFLQNLEIKTKGELLLEISKLVHPFFIKKSVQLGYVSNYASSLVKLWEDGQKGMKELSDLELGVLPAQVFPDWYYKSIDVIHQEQSVITHEIFKQKLSEINAKNSKEDNA
jgi:hypothetical protein